MATDYRYSGSGKSLSPAEAEAAMRRNGVSPELATSKEARAGAPLESVPTLKGAVKVNGFPAKSPYPFAEIARDGGVWKLDPAAFTWRSKPVKDVSIRTAASKWAIDHGMKAKVVLDGGMVYVQFSKDGAR